MTKVYKLKCEHNHEFYLPMNTNENIEVALFMLNNMTCPLCRNKKIDIDPDVKEVV